VSTGGQDLFVICKSCGAEVSPYITECPYCGNRLRKRAPKIDRHGHVSERGARPRPAPSLPRLRPGEMPGIRPDSRPYATALLFVLGFAGCLVWRTGAVSLAQISVHGGLNTHWWRILTAPFVYDNTGYAFVALSIIAIYGTLLEHRHGPLPVLALFLLGGVGGVALAGHAGTTLVLGGDGAALAMLLAWAMRDVIDLIRGRGIDGDLLGTAVLGGVIVLMPLAVSDASLVADGVGAAAGILLGYPLARLGSA
jgi:membrane associated rhomboid family serine protease